MRVAKFSDAVPVAFLALLFPAAMIYSAGKDLFLAPVPVYFVFGVCTLLALVMLWLRAKYYVLTEQGIRHKIFGICYRTTPWDGIQDVMCSQNPFRPQRAGKALIITVRGADVLREDAFYGSKEFYSRFVPSCIKGERFVIRITGMSNAGKILPFVQAKYGKVDYDTFSGSTGK